jgi:hypothetical protein
MTMKPAVQADPRKAARESLLLVARLKRAGAASFPVTVRNLSAVGMMIESDAELSVNESIVAEISGLGKVPGRIAWTQDNRAGMAFDAPVDPARARRPGLKAV